MVVILSPDRHRHDDPPGVVPVKTVDELPDRLLPHRHRLKADVSIGGQRESEHDPEMSRVEQHGTEERFHQSLGPLPSSRPQMDR